MSRQLLLSRQTHLRAAALLIGGSLAYSTLSHRKPIANDSGGKPWAGKSQIITQQRAFADEAKNSDADSEVVSVVATDLKDDDVPLFDADSDSGAWASLSTRLSDAQSALSATKWSKVGETVSDLILPNWASDLPGYFAKLQRELEMASGSLAEEIWQEAQDPLLNPEISRIAQVRISRELCTEEKLFQQRRKAYTTRALAKYLGIPEQDVQPEDVPTIAMCGSGGGLRGSRCWYFFISFGTGRRPLRLCDLYRWRKWKLLAAGTLLLDSWKTKLRYPINPPEAKNWNPYRLPSSRS